MFKTVAMALVAGSLMGVWFCWQQQRDEHLFNMYACAHSHKYDSVSLEEAYILCEKAVR